MPNFKLPAYGQPLFKAEKRADELLLFNIDLTDTLDKDEVVISIEEPKFIVPITTYRSRKGKFLEITIPELIIEGASNAQEARCTIKYSTNTGSIRTASFIVKVYR